MEDLEDSLADEGEVEFQNDLNNEDCYDDLSLCSSLGLFNMD